MSIDSVDTIGSTTLIRAVEGDYTDIIALLIAAGVHLLLARAVGAEQSSRIGNQTGGRVFLFLYTDDFWHDFHAYKAKNIVFVREPKEESYGTVAVFRDPYGNLWDLVQRSS